MTAQGFHVNNHVLVCGKHFEWLPHLVLEQPRAMSTEITENEGGSDF